MRHQPAIRLRVILLRVTPRHRAANHVRQLQQIVPRRILNFDFANHAGIAFGVIDSLPQITSKLAAKFPPAAAVNHHRCVVQSATRRAGSIYWFIREVHVLRYEGHRV